MILKNHIKFKNLLHIITSSLDYLDESLAGHSTRVAFDMMSLLKEDSRFTYEEVCKITWTTLFHDIGMIEKRPISDLIAGEANSDFSHAEYGALFMKYCSPFPEYDVIVKYHHSPYRELEKTELDEKTKDVIALLHLIDKVDLCYICNRAIDIGELTHNCYKESVVNSIRSYLPNKQALNQEEVEENLLSYLADIPLTDEQQFAFLNILISSFDFRSRYTAIHCATVSTISDCLAKLYELDETTCEKIHLGSLLHDIGKIAIPHRILESPGKLNEEDWKVMKSHASISESILKDRVDDEVLQIAIRHHERLDGAGYPYGLTEKDLTLSQRIVGVADIISALSQKRSYKEAVSLDEICNIIKEMSESGGICPSVCNTFIANKDAIYQQIVEATSAKSKQYEQITDEYAMFDQERKIK